MPERTELVPDDSVQALLLQNEGHMVDVAHVVHGEDVRWGNVAEGGDLVLGRLIQHLSGATYDDVGGETQRSQFLCNIF